jgi:gliding motility-associated-like protein
VAVEGCNDAIVTFRLPTVAATPRIINYGILGTATNKVDYDSIPVSVTIPAGQDSVNLVIHPILDTLSEGTEYIVLIVNTSPCTYDTLIVPIKDNTHLETILPADTVVCDDTLTLEVLASGGRTPYTYQWNTGDSTAQVDVYSPVTTWYYVTTNDACAQENIDSIEVTISQPVISILGDTICSGQQATVSSSTPGAVSWNWSNGATTPSINVSPASTSTYTLIVQDTIGCTDTASAEVIVNQSPGVTASNDTAICEGDSIDLLAWGGTVYTWSNGTNGAVNTVAPGLTGTYTVTVTDANGCSGQEDVTVTVVEVPVPAINAASDTICRGETISLNAYGGSDYVWNDGSSSSSISVSPTETTMYTVTVSNSGGGTTCSANTAFLLGVKRCNSFFVPSAFTPDGDGLNDDFGLIGEFKAIDRFEMSIFDRWGKLIFYTTDVNRHWDATDGNGNPANTGAYVYLIRIQETYSEPYEFTGTVTLLR